MTDCEIVKFQVVCGRGPLQSTKQTFSGWAGENHEELHLQKPATGL